MTTLDDHSAKINPNVTPHNEVYGDDVCRPFVTASIKIKPLIPLKISLRLNWSELKQPIETLDLSIWWQMVENYIPTKHHRYMLGTIQCNNSYATMPLRNGRRNVNKLRAT